LNASIHTSATSCQMHAACNVQDIISFQAQQFKKFEFGTWACFLYIQSSDFQNKSKDGFLCTNIVLEQSHKTLMWVLLLSFF